MTRSSLGECCLNCKTRYPACHDTCEKYKDAKRVWEEKKRSIKRVRDQYKDYDDFKITNVCKTRKHARGQV